MSRRRELEDKKLNICAKFVLPMVAINHNNLPKEFINSYIDREYHVYIVFEKDNNFVNLNQNYLQYLKDNNEYIESYEEDTDEYIIKFNIPEEYYKEFDLFIQGKYSKFSENYKNRLCFYFGRKSIKEGHLVNIVNAIYPEDFKRLQIAKHLDVDVSLIREVYDPPNLTKELYNNITNLVTIHEKRQEDSIRHNDI